MRQRFGLGVRLLAMVVGLAVFTAACGDGDDGDEGATGSGSGSASSPAEEEPGRGGEPQTGPGTPAPQPLAEQTSVTLVVSFAIEPFAPLLLADELGEFEKENLDVEIAMIPSNEATVQVASNRALLQVGGVTAAGFNAMASDTGLRYVANVHYQSDENREGLWVRRDLLGDDGEIDPDNIPGMRVALGSGGLSSVSTIPVERWLEEYGYTVDDIEPVPIGGADMLVAVEQGSVDAGYLITPFWQEPTVADCCVLVTPQPPLAASVYVVNDGALADETDRETLRAVFRALMRTVRTHLQGDYHSDPEVMEVLSRVLDTDAEVIASSPSLRFDPDLGLETDILTETQEVWIDAGEILEFDEPLPLDEVADTSIVEELLAE